jgi:hypothetical protein
MAHPAVKVSTAIFVIRGKSLTGHVWKKMEKMLKGLNFTVK